MLRLELQEMHIYFYDCHAVFDFRLFRHEHHSKVRRVPSTITKHHVKLLAIQVCRFSCWFNSRQQIHIETTGSFSGMLCIFLVLVEGFVESEYEVTKVQDIESHFHWLEGWGP